MSKDKIGWDSYEEEELNDEKMAVEDLTEDAHVGCCDTAFHVVSSPEEFQELLEGLHSEGSFADL